jgi:hypothetical protein
MMPADETIFVQDALRDVRGTVSRQHRGMGLQRSLPYEVMVVAERRRDAGV